MANPIEVVMDSRGLSKLKTGIAVDDELTIVVLVNSGTCDPHLIADQVAAVYLAK
jgi:hypothetical protein